jgi:hypothetical protein
VGKCLKKYISELIFELSIIFPLLEKTYQESSITHPWQLQVVLGAEACE